MELDITDIKLTFSAKRSRNNIHQVIWYEYSVVLWWQLTDTLMFQRNLSFTKQTDQWNSLLWFFSSLFLNGWKNWIIPRVTRRKKIIYCWKIYLLINEVLSAHMKRTIAPTSSQSNLCLILRIYDIIHYTMASLYELLIKLFYRESYYLF